MKPPAASDGMVVYDGVSKFFPVRARPGREDSAELMVALDRINASVRKGELITLLGPSGCGKTTLLRLTAGLIVADEGRITLAGTPVTGARDFIELVGLGAFAEHFPHELSGGMQQRVGIARALMRKPILIFMDEPFGALDAQTREQLQEDFLAIWSRTGATVVFVTHSIDEALILSDRIFVFHTEPGRIRTVVESPVAGERLGGDVRAHPDFGKCRAELREMLRSEP